MIKNSRKKNGKEMTVDDLAGIVKNSFVDLETRLDNKFGKIDERFDKIEATMDHGFAEVNSRLTSVESRLWKVEINN